MKDYNAKQGIYVNHFFVFHNMCASCYSENGRAWIDHPPTYLSSVEMYDLDIGFIQYLQPLPVGRYLFVYP